MDSFLRVLSFQVHEWKQLIEVSVYYYLPPSYFVAVANNSTVDVSVLSTSCSTLAAEMGFFYMGSFLNRTISPIWGRLPWFLQVTVNLRRVYSCSHSEWNMLRAKFHLEICWLIGATGLTSSPKPSLNPWRTWLGVRVIPSGAPRIRGRLLSFSITPCVQVSNSSSSIVSW